MTWFDVNGGGGGRGGEGELNMGGGGMTPISVTAKENREKSQFNAKIDHRMSHYRVLNKEWPPKKLTVK